MSLTQCNHDFSESNHSRSVVHHLAAAINNGFFRGCLQVVNSTFNSSTFPSRISPYSILRLHFADRCDDSLVVPCVPFDAEALLINLVLSQLRAESKP